MFKLHSLAASGLAAMSITVSAAHGAPSGCYATATSLTPADWVSPVPATAHGPLRALHLVEDLPLPGPANRFDYQNVDSAGARLYISHMGAGTLVVFDLDASRVVAEVGGVRGATGVLAVPERHTVYVSASAAHQVVVIDDRTLGVTARVTGVRFPDGIAWAPGAGKVFVSDESGSADVVIDAGANTRRAAIPLGSEAGNTHYDPVSHCVLVAAQSVNQLLAIDPVTERVARRYDLRGVDGPHGFAIDNEGRLAFITGEDNATLQVLDLRTMRVLATERVGGSPDVLAWDPAWRRLYVASEEGVVSEFVVEGNGLTRLGDLRAPHAHSVAVDPRTHRVYLPLQNVGGHPVLRILAP